MSARRLSWTVIGVPGSSSTPIVDERGNLTPFARGWSLQVGVIAGGTHLGPSHTSAIHQRALDGFPVIETVVTFQDHALRLVTFADASAVHLEASLDKTTRPHDDRSLVFSLRPSNPEGNAVIDSIAYLPDRTALRVNDTNLVLFSTAPVSVHCATRGEGGAEAALSAGWHGRHAEATRCESGSASSVALFRWGAVDGQPPGIRASIPFRADTPPVPSSPSAVLAQWREWFAGRAEILTPDLRLNELVRFSLATLALSGGMERLQTEHSGHAWWSPHAALTAQALEVFGIHDHTPPLLRAIPSSSNRRGRTDIPAGEPRFIPHRAWLAWHHALLTGDTRLPEELSSSMALRARRPVPGEPGEDGPAWPGEADVWLLAGLEAATRLGELLHLPEGARGKGHRANIRNNLQQAFREGRGHPSPQAAHALRGGWHRKLLSSLSAMCTLRLLDASDPWVSSTIDELRGSLGDDLTRTPDVSLMLRVAHSYLLAGRRRDFAQILAEAVQMAAPTGAFPTGLHVENGERPAGDHAAALAAAEFVLMLRDCFVYERREPTSGPYDLVLLAGLAPTWFAQGASCVLKNAPVHGGRILVESHPGSGLCTVTCHWEHRWFEGPRHFIVDLPPGIEPIECRGWISLRQGAEGGTTLTLPPESFTLTLRPHLSGGAATPPVIA